MSEKTSIGIVGRYLTALEVIKKQTIVPGGAPIKTKEFAETYKTSDALLIVLSKKFNILSRDKSTENGKQGLKYVYKWMYGDAKLSIELAEKIQEACRTWKSKDKDVRDEIKSPARVPQPAEIKPKNTTPVFTGAHLQIINYLMFDVPTTVQIDTDITLEEVSKIHWEVNASVVVLNAYTIKFADNGTNVVQQESRLCSLRYENKGFILSQRFSTTSSGTYMIKTVPRNS